MPYTISSTSRICENEPPADEQPTRFPIKMVKNSLSLYHISNHIQHVQFHRFHCNRPCLSRCSPPGSCATRTRWLWYVRCVDLDLNVPSCLFVSFQYEFWYQRIWLPSWLRDPHPEQSVLYSRVDKQMLTFFLLIPGNKDAVTVSFSQYFAQVGPGLPISDNRKNCQMTLSVL